MVWRADDGAKPEYQANILQCLERAGVQTEPLGNAAPTGSGIVIVSSINDHSLERVRQLIRVATTAYWRYCHVPLARMLHGKYCLPAPLM